MADMSRFDGERLHLLMARSRPSTPAPSAPRRFSTTGRNTGARNSRKVMPVEYRRALTGNDRAAQPLSGSGQ